MNNDKVGFMKVRGRVFINANDLSKYLWKRAANTKDPESRRIVGQIAEEIDLNAESARKEM